MDTLLSWKGTSRLGLLSTVRSMWLSKWAHSTNSNSAQQNKSVLTSSRLWGSCYTVRSLKYLLTVIVNQKNLEKLRQILMSWLLWVAGIPSTGGRIYEGWKWIGKRILPSGWSSIVRGGSAYPILNISSFRPKSLTIFCRRVRNFDLRIAYLCWVMHCM